MNAQNRGYFEFDLPTSKEVAVEKCPDPLQFTLLLARRLDAEQAATLESHLRACPQCRAAVESLQQPTDVIRAKRPAPALPTPLPAGPDRPVRVPQAPVSGPAYTAADDLPPPPDSFVSRLRLSSSNVMAAGSTVFSNDPPTKQAPPSHEPGQGKDQSPNNQPNGEPLLGQLHPNLAGALPRPEVPGYELLSLLGQGGMGLVYLARDIRLNRLVALKMVIGGPHAAEIGSFERFRAEAVVVARLHHPHIVQIYEVGEVHGLPYLALEYLPGGNLHRRMAGQPQPTEQCARLVEQLARAIQHAHEQGIIHRDIKPANVLLQDGIAALGASGPKLTDFGLAKLIDSVDARTRAGDIVGTPGYLAPEQAGGDSTKMGPPVDIYALGVLLYELLTGRPPFQGGTPLDTVLLARIQDPIAPRRLQPRIARDLETICLKCLEKEPHRRYASATALAEDLQRYLNQEPIKARPASLLDRTIKWARRRPTQAALTGTTVLAIVLGFVGVTLALRQAQAKASDELVARNTAENERRRADGERNRAELQMVRGYLERGITLCETGDVGRGLIVLVNALELIERLKPRLTVEESWMGAKFTTRRMSTRSSRRWDFDLGEYLSHLEWLIRSNLAAWHPRLGIRLRAMLNHNSKEWIWAVAFSPDGKYAATGCYDGSARLWDAETGAFIDSLQAGIPIDTVQFSPDSKYLLTAGSSEDVQGQAQLWDVANRRKVGPSLPYKELVSTSPTLYLSNAGLSPDGKTIFAQTEANTLRFVPVSSMAQSDTSSPRAAADSWHLRSPITRVVFSPNSKNVFISEITGSIRRWSLATKLPIGPSWNHAGPVAALAVSPDGRTVLSGGFQTDPDTHQVTGEANLWNADTGERIARLPHTWRVKVVAFAPNGRTCLTAGLAFESDRTGTPRRKGEKLEGWLQLWDVVTGQPVGSPLPHPLPVWSAAFSGDGTRVVTGCEDGYVRVWCVQTGKELGPQPRFYQNRGTIPSLARHPNGRTFLSANATEYTSAMLFDVGPPILYGQPFVLPRQLAEPVASMVGLAASPPNPWLVVSKIEVLSSGADGITAMEFSPQGQVLQTATEAHRVRFWDWEKQQLLPGEVNLPDGMLVRAIGSDGRTCVAWNDAPGQNWKGALWDLEHHQAVRWFPADQRLAAAVYSGDGRRLATAGSEESQRRTAVVWDTATGRQIIRVKAPTELDHPLGVLALSHDGAELAGVQGFHTCRIPWVWHTATGERKTTFPRLPGPVDQLAFDSNGRILVELLGGDVGVWERDGGTARAVGVMLVHREKLRALHASPDGRIVQTAAGTQLFLWDPRTGLRIGPPMDHEAQIATAAYHRSGQLLATAGSDKQVRLWKVPAPLQGSVIRIRTWVEAITRLHLEAETIELIVPLDDTQVGGRYVDLRRRRGGSPE